jgi:signal transduction histidine kinase
MQTSSVEVGAPPLRKENTRSSYTILIVDDGPDTLTTTAQFLKREGHAILCASTGQQALDLLSEQSVHLMLVDYVLPDMTGAEVIEQSRVINDLVQVVLQTDGSACPPRELLRTLAIQGYHDKGDSPEKLLHRVDIACRAYTVLERTRRSEHIKAQLVANVSHELRTPLNVILGYIELMREGACGPQSAESTEALTTINRQGLILLHLINELLDMSKLQAGAMQLARESVSISAVVDEFRDALPILVGNVDVGLQWEVAPDSYAMGDASKVRSIVQNLLSNAAKFTTQGRITIRVWTADAHTYLSVRDTGPGIHPDDQERIFELFEQAEARGNRRQGGTGIGLHLARALSRLMGGDLTVESSLGEGATFTLRLPVSE